MFKRKIPPIQSRRKRENDMFKEEEVLESEEDIEKMLGLEDEN